MGKDSKISKSVLSTSKNTSTMEPALNYVRPKPILTIYNTNNCIVKAILNQANENNPQPAENLPEGIEKVQLKESKKQKGSKKKKNVTSTSYSISNTCENCSCKPYYYGIYTPDGNGSAPADWQSGLLTPSQRFSDLYNYEHLMDVTITFPDCSTEYKVHRLVLATASPVFEKMFYGGLITDEAKTGNICLHDCKPEAVKWLIENLYCGKITFSYVQEALSVFSLSQMYQISGVAELAKEYLKQELTVTTVSQVFSVARTHSEEYLLDACLKKISTDWSQLSADRFSKISEDLWMHLLHAPILPISEVVLIKALYQWCKLSIEKDESNPWPLTVREVMQKFIPYLRLLAISPEKFIDEIMPLNLFKPVETNHLLMKIRGQNVQLPPKIKCDEVVHSRVLLTDDTLKYAVMTRPLDHRRLGTSTAAKVTFIDNLSVNFPILLHQIQASDNHTLRESQMTILDSSQNVIGVAKPVNSLWRFSQSVHIHPNKVYRIEIDRALISGKNVCKREFNIHSNDLKFKGFSCDNYFRLYYWLAHPKDY